MFLSAEMHPAATKTLLTLAVGKINKPTAHFLELALVAGNLQGFRAGWFEVYHQ